jgi:hypothetical protein
MTVENHYRKTAGEGHEGHAEQKTMVSLDRIAKPRHVAENRRQHRTGGQNAAHPTQWRHEKADGGEQFPNALAPTPPGLSSHPAKDVNRLGGRREFEKQRLDHDSSRDQLTNPAHNLLTGGEGVRWGGRAPACLPDGGSGWTICFEVFELRKVSVVLHVFEFAKGREEIAVANRSAGNIGFRSALSYWDRRASLEIV